MNKVISGNDALKTIIQSSARKAANAIAKSENVQHIAAIEVKAAADVERIIDNLSRKERFRVIDIVDEGLAETAMHQLNANFATLSVPNTVNMTARESSGRYKKVKIDQGQEFTVTRIDIDRADAVSVYFMPVDKRDYSEVLMTHKEIDTFMPGFATELITALGYDGNDFSSDSVKNINKLMTVVRENFRVIVLTEALVKLGEKLERANKKKEKAEATMRNNPLFGMF